MKLERIKTIYEELERYVVQLHPDPRTLGPQYLNDQIATTRNYLNAVSRIQLEVHQEKQYLSREIRSHETAYQVSFDEYLANDERVRKLPSIEDRKATVAVFLRSEKQAIENFKATLQDVEYVEKAVKHRHKELTSTMSEIKLQRSLIRDEIDTGAMYGDERTYGSGSTPQRSQGPVGMDDLDEEELARLLDDATESNPVALPTPDPVPALPKAEDRPDPSDFKPPTDPPPVTDPVTEDQAINAFLGDPVVAAIAEFDQDFSDVFNDL